ncbi:MAG: DUF2141 domain-containing protein [Bacteroidetes bacterium]|nr:DUF2141 domain-containing protein [Bacteroidota bacterium]
MMILFLFFQFIFAVETNSTVTLKVQGIESIKGNIRIGIYDSSSTFPKEGKQMKGIVAKVESKYQSISFDLPSGKKYAFAVFHDINGNDKMDKNLMGIPTENYGFSNNARATFSAPSFSDAAVYIKENIQLSIRLQ